MWWRCVCCGGGYYGGVWVGVGCDGAGATHVWKSATVAFSPGGSWMYSFPAPLMIVRGTISEDTEGMLAFISLAYLVPRAQ